MSIRPLFMVDLIAGMRYILVLGYRGVHMSVYSFHHHLLETLSHLLFVSMFLDAGKK